MGTGRVVRYRFSEFTLSPQRRLLVRAGQEVPLIPRYFDLLLLLIERRAEAVHRREIFDRVWTGVIVSESALSQAVRTIRLTLGDDSKEPRFIRTVSRHGYQFVFPELIEEQDDVASTAAPPTAPAINEEPLEPGLGRAARIASKQWTRGSAGGALAGVAAGGIGGLILAAAPGSAAPIAIAPVLAVIGGGCGAIGGAGVGAGLALGEAATGPQRVQRALALIGGGAIGGGVVGAVVEWLARWGLDSLVGIDVYVGGGLEGVIIGAAAGLAFAIATLSTEDGVSIPRAGKRLRAALITAGCCGIAGVALTLAGRPLAGGTIHAIASAAHGSRATLAPLGRLIGEPDFGPVSGAILAFGEGGVFGLGLALGLLRRQDSE
jgi:DNA-binding winged helix-turn-helix (wHTH) protein